MLFLGNSYTFYHDVPGQVVALLGEAGFTVEAERVAEGGATLESLVETHGALDYIARGDYSAVVIQEQSSGPLHDRVRFANNAERLAHQVTQTGAQLYWYQTWPRAEGSEVYQSAWSGGSPAEMNRRVAHAYREMAQRVGGQVVPVGDAFLRVMSERPELALHVDDLHHATPLGGHLSALVFARVMGSMDVRTSAYCPEGVTQEDGAYLREVVMGSV